MLVSEVPAFREYWYPVAYSDEVTAAPYVARLFAEDIVVWRPSPGAAASAAFDECPHRSGRLSQGWVASGCLVCPYHGWQFEPGGACTRIPASAPEVPVPPRAHLASVLVEERYGLVWVCIGVPRQPIPLLPELMDPGYTLIHEIRQVWAASAPRMIDNALDVSHVAFVHRGTVGDPDNPRMSDFEVQRDGDRITFSVSYTSQVRGVQQANVGLDGAVTRTTHAELVQPFVFRGVLAYENGLRHVLFKTCTPVDDRTTLFFQFIGRNDDPSPDRWEDITAVDRAVQAEDRALLEAINPDFPIESRTEVHTRSDRMTVEYRRILAGLCAETTSVRSDAEWARAWR